MKEIQVFDGDGIPRLAPYPWDEDVFYAEALHTLMRQYANTDQWKISVAAYYMIHGWLNLPGKVEIWKRDRSEHDETVAEHIAEALNILYDEVHSAPGYKVQQLELGYTAMHLEYQRLRGCSPT